MATLNEDPQYNGLGGSPHHHEEQQHNQNQENHIKEDSEFDKELFQSSINNPIILQHKHNNAAESLFSDKNENHEQNGNENQSTPNQVENGQSLTVNPEDNPKIQRYSDAIIQDITHQPEEKSQENSQLSKEEEQITQNKGDNQEIPVQNEQNNTQNQQNEVVIEEERQESKQSQEQEQKSENKKPEQKQSQQQQSQQTNDQQELMQFAQIFGVANTIKDQAKNFVQKKQYKEAIRLYEECLQVIHISNFKFGEDKNKYRNILKEQVELTLMLFCNLSLCYFNEGNYEKSLEYGEKVNIIDQNHLKAAYRRALALKKLQRYEKAFEEIKNARLIAIGKQQVDENINKEYKIIKQLYTEEKGVTLSKNNSTNLDNSSGSGSNSKKTFSQLGNSSLTNVAEFLDNNFPGSMKTSPFYLMCSSFTTYVVLKRFMNISLLSKPAIIGGPLLSLSIFGFLQGKSIYVKLLCGGLIGLVSSILFKFADFSTPKALTL